MLEIKQKCNIFKLTNEKNNDKKMLTKHKRNSFMKNKEREKENGKFKQKKVRKNVDCCTCNLFDQHGRSQFSKF